MAARTHVFVYGTLRAGEDNDINRLEPQPQFLGFGVVEGDLFDFGRHPGIVLREGAPYVLGELYACAPKLIRTLDDVEMNYPERPGLYRRAWRSVACGGRAVRCVVYELTDGGASSVRRIPPADLVDWVSWRLRSGDRRRATVPPRRIRSSERGSRKSVRPRPPKRP